MTVPKKRKRGEDSNEVEEEYKLTAEATKEKNHE